MNLWQDGKYISHVLKRVILTSKRIDTQLVAVAPLLALVQVYTRPIIRCQRQPRHAGARPA